MERLFVYGSNTFEIAGFTLYVRREKGAPALYGPSILNSFSVTQKNEQPDFVLRLSSDDSKYRLHMNYQKEGDILVFTSFSEQEKMILESDADWRSWSLFNTLSGSCIDRWFENLGNLFCWSVIKYGALVIHGVILEWNGKGIVLSAASGTGKTTHARLWRKQENALIINGDRALIRKFNDTWYACGIPWSGSSGESVNRHVQIHSIVFLSQAEENRSYPISPSQAIRFLLPRVIAPSWHTELSTIAIDRAIECMETIPAVRLECRPDEDSVHVLKETLSSL